MRLAIEYRRQPRSGSVLLAVLIVLPLLFLAAYQFSQLMMQEYAAAQSALKTTQAKALANSGVNMCAVYLSSSTAMSGNLNNNPYSNTGAFQNIPVSDGGGKVIGRFSIVAPYDQNDPNFSANSQSSFRYGVIDESSKININALYKIDKGATLAKVLTNLNTNTVTSQITDSINTWIDGTSRPNGADNTYYNGLTPAYNLKAAPFDSVDELLLVEGVTPLVLYGTDWNRNGMQDPGEDSGGGWDPGLAPYLTVYSRELNTDSQNKPRTWLNTAITSNSFSTYLSGLQTSLGDNSVANFVILYRVYGSVNGRPSSATNRAVVDADFSSDVAGYLQKNSGSLPPATSISPYDIIDKTLYFAVRKTGPGAPPPPFQISCTVTSKGNAQLLATLLDKTSNTDPSKTPEFSGKLNLLTAPQSVLNAFASAGVAGLTPDDVGKITQSRPDVTQSLPTDAKYQSLAWLISDVGLSPAVAKGLDAYFTSRTTVYRVQAIGYFDDGGPVARIEAVIDATNGSPRIVMWRDLSELGKGYNLSGTNQ